MLPVVTEGTMKVRRSEAEMNEKIVLNRRR